MAIQKTVYNSRLIPAYSYTVRINGTKKEFLSKDKAEIGKYIQNVWDSETDGFFNVYSPAYIYANIDWDSDNILYCKYELKDD